MELLRPLPEIALKAFRAMAYGLRIWMIELGSPHLASGHARLAFQNQTIVVALIIVAFAFIPSSSTDALPPVPLITGPGYQDGNIAQAFQIANRRGRDPFLRRQNRQFQKRPPQNADSNGGNTNYLLSVPIVTIPGRRLNVGLTLYYNSQVWTKQPSTEPTRNGGSQPVIDMVFDHDSDWPAPGWLLSFGAVIQAGYGAALQDSDGTLHPFYVQISTVNDNSVYTAFTTDGSMINYTGQWNSNGTAVGTAKFPNGTTVTYGAGAPNGHVLYATRITDANGNFITISYVGNVGPKIDYVEDSLGRFLAFVYDPNNRLVAITAPGLNDGPAYPVVNLHYSQMNLVCNFAPTSEGEPVQVKKPGPVYVIDGIYFRDSTGYWFGNYSSYGMISTVSQRGGMTLTGMSLSPGNVNQGNLNPGIMIREQVYDYPTVYNVNPPKLLSGPPTYTHMTESWAGMDEPPAVTTYAVNSNADPRTVDTVYPDGTHVSELRNNHPGKFDDGLLVSQITYDRFGTRVKQIDTNWSPQPEDYDSPLVESVKVTDQLNQVTTTVYDYIRDLSQADSPPTNQLNDIKELDYDGTVLRATYYFYSQDPNYTKRYIFNLPVSVVIHDMRNGQDQIVARTDYLYDQWKPKETPGVVCHDPAFDPEFPGYDSSTDYRGNVTQITRYKNPSYPPSGGITESRSYDITGNLISRSAPCCLDTDYTYTPCTQYAYPEKITRGSTNPALKAQLSRSFTYDFGTGVMLTSTDFNGLTTHMNYDYGRGFRLAQISSPTGASITYQYDPQGLGTTQIQSDADGNIVAQNVVGINGLGLTDRVQFQVQNNTAGAASYPAVISQQYDLLGRLWKRSQPYQLGQQPLWTTLTYDTLSRVTNIQNPDGSQESAYYDETNRPSSASTLHYGHHELPLPGQTVRTHDQMGTEKWLRKDAFGQIAEVVEPPPIGNGSVFEPGNVETSYSYSVLGQLTQVVQGATVEGNHRRPGEQEREFQYDALGRLTAEYLPEKSRTLDGNGIYVGRQGQWSDVFTYDDRSNLISHVDARGVKTIYEFADDPLNRLQSVSYQTPAAPNVDPSSPIDTTDRAVYEYMPTGDVTRLSSVTLLFGYPDQLAAEQEQYSYDPQGPVGSKTVSFLGKSPLVSTYKYDSLNRLREEIYPIEYGTPAQAGKKLDYTYGIGDVLTDLKVDGADYASQFAYNPAGQAKSITVGPSAGQQTVETYDYDPMTNLLHSQTVMRPGTAPELLKLTYFYFPTGQLEDVTEGNWDFTYHYDALGRLLTAQGWGPNSNPSSPSWQETYAYDYYGNRLSVSTSGNGPDGSPIPLDGLAGSPTPANRLSALTYSRKTNRIETPGFAYDAAGNETEAPRLDGSTVRYRYDQAGRLTQVTDGSGKLLEQYVYGANGLRLQKLSPTGGTTSYFWDGVHVIAEYNQPNGQPNWAWSNCRAYLGERVLATFAPKESGEVVYYHHPDRLGTRLITNSTDDTAVEQLTLPFGTLIPSASSDPINPIFTSYDRSSVTGLDYAINRQYHSLERFTQADPAGIGAADLTNPQSLNLYSYVRNDPINLEDPVGLTILNFYSEASFAGPMPVDNSEVTRTIGEASILLPPIDLGTIGEGSILLPPIDLGTIGEGSILLPPIDLGTIGEGSILLPPIDLTIDEAVSATPDEIELTTGGDSSPSSPNASYDPNASSSSPNASYDPNASSSSPNASYDPNASSSSPNASYDPNTNAQTPDSSGGTCTPQDNSQTGQKKNPKPPHRPLNNAMGVENPAPCGS